MAVLADKRAGLVFSLSLLAEHEITQLIRMGRGIASRMPIEQ
jgi:hypothetical protein